MYDAGLRIPRDDYAALYHVLCTAAAVLAHPHDWEYWRASLRRDVEAYQARHPSPFIAELLGPVPECTRPPVREARADEWVSL